MRKEKLMGKIFGIALVWLMLGGTLSIADAAALDSPTPEQRDKIIEIAGAYATHPWTPDGDNMWHEKAKGNQIDTPDSEYGGWWFPGQTNEGVPYKWGGFSSLRPFVISSGEDFDEGIAAGLAAGDITCDDWECPYAVGVDCSGFVSRCWQLPEKEGSSGLVQLSSKKIEIEKVERGDILYRPGHVMLVGEDFDSTREPKSIWVYEASGIDWKVSHREYTVDELEDNGYTAYACPGSIFQTPTEKRVSGLYAGAANPGVVYKYAPPDKWEKLSLFSVFYAPRKIDHEAILELGYAVLCLTEYKGFLYAGIMSTSDPMNGIGRVYRLHTHRDKSKEINEWILVGDNLDDQVSSLVVYKDKLYAGTSWRGGRLYRCDGTFNWSKAVDHTDPGDWSGFRTAFVWNNEEEGGDGLLYLGDIGWDIIGRWDGVTPFQHIAHLGGSCIYDFVSYEGELYASAYLGRLLKSSDGLSWTTVINYQDGNMWELEIFQNSLYMSLNDGRLQRYAGTVDGIVMIEEIWTAPDGNGIISMTTGKTTGKGELFLGIGGEAGAWYGSSETGTGKVYRYDGKTEQISTKDLGTGVQVLYYATRP